MLGRVTQNFQLMGIEKSRTNIIQFISHTRQFYQLLMCFNITITSSVIKTISSAINISHKALNLPFKRGNKIQIT